MISRGLHNVTAKYNYLYNANQLLHQYEMQQHPDSLPHHKNILPLYKIPSTVIRSEILTQLLAKANFVISKKHYSKYVADACLLRAKVHYLQGDYLLSQVLYHDTGRNFASRKAIATEALTGELRCLMQMSESAQTEETAQALQQLTDLKENPAALVTLAQYHIKKDEYAEAITLLEYALKNRVNKQKKDTWHYALAQLYEKQQSHTLASKHYAKVKDVSAIYINNKLLQPSPLQGQKSDSLSRENLMYDPD